MIDDRSRPELDRSLGIHRRQRAAQGLVVNRQGFERVVERGALGLPTASINGTLTASVGGIPLTRFGIIEGSRMGFVDLYPTISLRWNHGVHNFMIYGTGDIPVGTYDPSNLANLGIGHGAADGGIGYTYFNPAAGQEFSAVTGVTYQNGIDWHLDWGASQFLSKQMFVGAVGYFYQQLTADRGRRGAGAAKWD